MNGSGAIHFHDRTPLDKKYKTTYLGHEINRESNITHEISNKIQEVRSTWMKLHVYWKATNASKKWQLIIFDAVVRSKLLYGSSVRLVEVSASHYSVPLHDVSREHRDILHVPETGQPAQW